MSAIDRLSTALAGRYRIEREIGRGGMATVYLAEDIRHNRQVALKVLNPELSAALGADRFSKEIKLTASLQHPNILPLFDSGDAGGELYYVMPFAEGETLRARLASGPVSPAEGLAILRDVARALGYAHAKGVVHRDIKPENILLSGGAAIVADFGIAKAIDASRTDAGVSLTAAGSMLGTPAYMAPEQALGEAVDARTDVYAWGVLAYELMSGSHPFASKTTAQQIIAAHIHEPPKPLVTGATLPSNVSALILRSLAKSPGMRPSTGGELLSGLDTVGETPATAAGFNRRGALITAAALVALAILGTFIWKRSSATSSTVSAAATPADSAPSIAVLPFTNFGGVAENEVFADGVTEDVIANLATAGGLTVISRTSVMGYRGTTKPLKQIASELGVTSILEGSVRREGSRVRVVAELIDARSDAHRWGGTFDRELADVFAIQSEIARVIADTLRITLSEEAQRRLAVAPTKDTLAYQLYLQGRRALDERREESLRSAIHLFESAVARDSSFARAWQSIALAYVALPFQNTALAPTDLFPKAKAVLDRALRLDPDLAEARATRAYVAAIYDHDWKFADAEFKKAVAQAPSNSEIRRQYGLYLCLTKQTDAGIREEMRALTLDPLSLAIKQNTAAALMLGRRYDEAIARAKPLGELAPGNRIVWSVWIQSAWQADRLDEAIAALDGMQKAGFGSGPTHDEMKNAVARGGKSALARLLTGPSSEGMVRLLANLELKNYDEVFAFFEKANAERRVSVVFYLPWKALDPIRADPRFVSLVHRMGLD